MTRKRVNNLRSVLATAAALLVCVVALALGQWQLDRAAQKQAWHDAHVAQGLRSPLTADQGRVAWQRDVPEAQWHRPAVLQGQWLAQHTVYLDNRQMHGQPGFYVLTPLQLDAGDIVWVQRGWVPRHFQDRRQLPAIDTPAGQVQVQGRLAGPPARLWSLGSGDGVDALQPAIRQNLDITAWAQAQAWQQWPVTLVQTGDASEGLQRDWPQPVSSVAKHHGYAVQWFALAALAVGLLLWFQIWRPWRRESQVSHVFTTP